MGGEFLALATEVVGFYAVVFVIGVAIEVDADKDGIAVAIGNGGAAREGDELIGASRHGHGDAFFLEQGFHLERNFKGEGLFVNATPVCAFVFSAVAGVDDDA